MKNLSKIFVPIICIGIGYLIGVGQPSLLATNTILGGEDTALKQKFVTIEDAVVRNSIEAENASWDIYYNESYGVSIVSADVIHYRRIFASLDQVPTEEGNTVFLGSPVRLAQRFDGQWMLTDFIAQTDWVSGETTTDCLTYQDGTWWAAQTGYLQ